MPGVLTSELGAVETAPGPESLAARAADWLLDAVAGQDRAAVAISGGGTPRLLFQRLGTRPLVSRFPWPAVHWFWVDERLVPPDDPDSNFGLARRTFLRRARVPADHLHPVRTEGITPEQAAHLYEADLKAFYGNAKLDPARPLFAAVLLGLGEDGHTASLVPGHDAMAERDRWAVPVIGARPQPRVTLTVPVLASTRHAAVLVSGAGKRAALA
ncbi:MAG: 6-phosphogluconolactonase, partial [Rhodospirillaceae bacterium]|nr:6-phosphogluconolactonase [Rhodospirillaceae bacterium]